MEHTAGQGGDEQLAVADNTCQSKASNEIKSRSGINYTLFFHICFWFKPGLGPVDKKRPQLIPEITAQYEQARQEHQV